MGMFDEVIADFKCPHCTHVLSAGEIEKNLETKNETWQTKVTKSLMEVSGWQSMAKHSGGRCMAMKNKAWC